MVISIEIKNVVMMKTLVDHGSSVDILYGGPPRNSRFRRTRYNTFAIKFLVSQWNKLIPTGI